MNVAVTVGEADDGKEVSQWVRVVAFGEAAEKIADRAKKADRIYCEGQLTLNTWPDKATGETKTGLNLAAFRCEKVPAIGKNRKFSDKDGAKQIAARQLSADAFRSEPHTRNAPPVQGRDSFDFGDSLPWGQ
jgi:single-stranded DNA-binding protein